MVIILQGEKGEITEIGGKLLQSDRLALLASVHFVGS
jgi:hypothetical protein